MTSMRVAIVHSKVKLQAKRANLRRIHAMLTTLIEDERANIDAVVTPPYPLTGPIAGYLPSSRSTKAVKNLAERITLAGSSIGHGVSQLVRFSEEDGIHLIAGPIIERAGPRLYMTVVHISPRGMIEAKYRKISLSKAEIEAGISPGKDLTVFNIGKGRIGVFVEDDLGLPEMFRYYQMYNVNLIVGYMLPYQSRYFRQDTLDGNVLTMELGSVKSFLTVRSIETGIPVVLVGGGVEGNHGNQGGLVAFMHTIPTDPEYGVAESRIKDADDLDNSPRMIIDLDVNASRPRRLENPDVAFRVLREMSKMGFRF